MADAVPADETTNVLPGTGACDGGARQQPETSSPLPNLIVIGAMKCATTALHRYLDSHPDIAMARRKELNFFFGDARGDGGGTGAAAWHRGNWHRGLDWYASQFDHGRVRGESSPGYTSPAHMQVAERMAAVVPEAQLVYLVRDPIDRAVSQYRHHRTDGTERRSPSEALLDPDSQYLARSRYYTRLRPYLERFPREQVMICSQEDLLRRRRQTVSELYRFVGVDDDFSSPVHDALWHVGDAEHAAIPPRLRDRLEAELRADAALLRDVAGRDFAGWGV